MHKHANAWSTCFLPGHMFPARDDRLGGDQVRRYPAPLCRRPTLLPVRAGASRLHRVCSASTLPKGIPDDAAGGRGRRRCAVSGYARHAMTSIPHCAQQEFCSRRVCDHDDGGRLRTSSVNLAVLSFSGRGGLTLWQLIGTTRWCMSWSSN